MGFLHDKICDRQILEEKDYSYKQSEGTWVSKLLIVSK
jgi:hypothetical protein